MSETSRSRRFIANAGWNLLRQFLTLAMSFFLTPILVHGLGTEGYALYSLSGVLLGAIAPLALGAGGATVRLAAEAVPSKDSRRLGDVFRHSLLLHATLPALAGLVVAAAAARIPAVFSVPAELSEASVRLFRWFALGAVWFIAGQAGTTLLIGLGRFSLSTLIDSSLAFALLGGSALLVRLGHGLAGIGPWFAFANAAVAVWALAAAWSALPRPAHPAAQDRPLGLRRFALESLPFFLSHVFGVINFQTDKVFIAAQLPLSSLTYYAIPFSIAQRLETIPRSITAAAFQMAGELSGLGRADALRKLYLKGTKLIGLVVAPAVVLLFALAPQFLTLWLGAEFSDRGTWPFRILLGGFSFYFLALNALFIAQGMGRAYYAVWSLGSSAALAFASWALFIPRFGVLGAAGGFLAAQATSALGLLYFFHRDVVPVSLAEFLRHSLLSPLASGGALLVLALLVHPGANTWPRLILVVLAGLSFSFAVSYATLDREEKDLLRQILRLRRPGPEPPLQPVEENPAA